MKHIAVRSLSLKKNKPYTVPGLGDRLHALLMAYNYSLIYNEQVTLHLTKDKYFREDKKNSWTEILNLFPSNRIFIQPHHVENIPEAEWIEYLKNKNIIAKTYFYSDYPHKNDFSVVHDHLFDATQIMNYYPCIKPAPVNINLPENFVTAQFDCNNIPWYKDEIKDNRKIPSTKIKEIISNYKANTYDTIFIGGDGNAELKGPGNLSNIAYAMSMSKGHIGAESGFLIMAQMYKKPNEITIYINKDIKSCSHHVLRNEKNGAKIVRI